MFEPFHTRRRRRRKNVISVNASCNRRLILFDMIFFGVVVDLDTRHVENGNLQMILRRSCLTENAGT